MIFDLDLLAGEARYRSAKFMTAWNWFEATDFPQAWAWELAVLLKTPGFAFEHWRIAFSWTPAVVHDEIPKILEYFQDDSKWNVLAAAQDNFESITLADGFDFLHAMLEARPKYAASVPLCVTQSLRQMRSEGASASDVADKFGIKKIKVTNFWLENRFDPFTGRDYYDC